MLRVSRLTEHLLASQEERLFMDLVTSDFKKHESKYALCLLDDDFRFCDRHGPRAQVNKTAVPSDLMCVSEAVMPRIILRLVQHFREYRY
jgi:hypothetical protein